MKIINVANIVCIIDEIKTFQGHVHNKVSSQKNQAKTNQGLTKSNDNVLTHTTQRAYENANYQQLVFCPKLSQLKEFSNKDIITLY